MANFWANLGRFRETYMSDFSTHKHAEYAGSRPITEAKQRDPSGRETNFLAPLSYPLVNVTSLEQSNLDFQLITLLVSTSERVSDTRTKMLG